MVMMEPSASMVLGNSLISEYNIYFCEILNLGFNKLEAR